MFQTILTIRAVPFSPELLKILLAVFLGLILISIILKFINVKLGASLRKRILKLSNLFLTAGIVYLIFLFLNYERIGVFGSRAWLLIAGVGFLVWLGFILYDIFVRMPRENKELGKKDKFERYLP